MKVSEEVSGGTKRPESGAKTSVTNPTTKGKEKPKTKSLACAFFSRSLVLNNTFRQRRRAVLVKPET